MGRSIHVPDMYKVKHPQEFAEKFPQKKKQPGNLSPSEQLRLDAMKALKEEPKEPEGETKEERRKRKRAQARIRAKAKKEEEE